MTNDKIKQMIRETLEPMFDELVELNFKIFHNLTENLPADMSDKEKEELINAVLKSHGDMLVNAIKTSLPDDFDGKVKEAYDGRRS